MNIIEFLIDTIPISASLLSVVASIVMSVLTKRITNKLESIEEDNSKMSIKWNDKEIEINNCSEKEILELITKLKNEDTLKKDSVHKQELWKVNIYRTDVKENWWMIRNLSVVYVESTNVVQKRFD